MAAEQGGEVLIGGCILTESSREHNSIREPLTNVKVPFYSSHFMGFKQSSGKKTRTKVCEMKSGGHAARHVEQLIHRAKQIVCTAQFLSHWIRIRWFLRKNPQLDATDEGPEQSHHAQELDPAQVLHCVLLAQVGYSIQNSTDQD